jgi:hypothetical protein
MLTGWPPPELLVTRQHHQRDHGGPLGQQALQRSHVHVALERVAGGGLQALGDREVDRAGAGELDVGPGGVEVGVARHDQAGSAGRGEQDPLRGAALVRGQHVREREQVGHRRAEPAE